MTKKKLNEFEFKDLLGTEYEVEDGFLKILTKEPVKLVKLSYVLQTKEGVQFTTSFEHKDFIGKEDEDD